MSAEGWYADPFEQHEARWFSAGRPTPLVRDGDDESQDPPPVATWDGELRRPAAEVDAADGAGLAHEPEPAHTTRAEFTPTIIGAGFH